VKGRVVAGVVLILLGTLALIYRGFDVPREARRAELGPVKITVARQRRVRIPVAVGAGAIALGAVLLLLRRR